MNVVRRLRVCHVMSADLWAGAEVQVATVASYLMEQSEIELTAVLFNDGWLAGELRRLGVAVTIVDESRHTSAAILMFLYRFFRRQPVDVVHTHRAKDSVLGTLAAKLAGVPHVVRTVHGLPEPMRGWDRLKFAAHQAIDRAVLFRFADRIVAVSRRMADVLTRSGYPQSALMYLHNGIDLSAVKPTRPPRDVRQAFGFGADDLIIGTAGRLAPVKGHTYLVDAAPLILQRQPRARIVFVGSGPLRNDLLARARRNGVDGACVFIDPAADDRAGLHDLVAAMDVFVLPSLAEGIPMALLEAMALERPAVATEVGGVPEIIVHRGSGLLVPARDPRALADACLELGGNPSLARVLGREARRIVETSFSREQHGLGLMNIYRRLAARRGGGRRVGPVSLLTGPVRYVIDRACRKVEHAFERGRGARLRRTPAPVLARLKAAKSVLVVCHGNIIRSPFAARLIAQALADRPVSIASAGLDAIPGRPPHPTAVLTAGPLSVDLSDHTAARIAPESVERADVIFVMDVVQLVALRSRFPEARSKTFLLTCLTPDGPLEIRDPVDGDESVFQTCYEHIVHAVGPIIQTLGHSAS